MVSGSTETMSFCVEQTGLAGCLTIVVGGGSYDSEISWSLVDGATGGAAFALAGGAETIEINCDVPGCTDATACNFNADATADDGSCTYAAENYDCDGNCTVDVDCNGDCGGTAEDLGCGCGNAAAAEGFDCDGNCLSDVDCNGDCGGTAEDLGCGCGNAAAAEGFDCDGNTLISLTPCQEEVANATGMMGEFVPDCAEDGSYAPIQCNGSTGYCWCVDEDGNEIPGTAIQSWVGTPDCSPAVEGCTDDAGEQSGVPTQLCIAVPGISLPSSSTHQQYPVLPLHCIGA
jgi:hypothetical protein